MTYTVAEWHHGMQSLGGCHLALGVFDGVHIGHQTLIQACVDSARAAGASAGVATFDRDPDLVVSPDSAAPQLLPLEDKLRFIGACGIDFVLVLPFEASMAARGPEEFIDDVILSAARPGLIHVGHDFRFGRFAEGDVATLRELGASRGFTVSDHDLVATDGAAVTSTRIRGLIASGRLHEAERLLGRPHRISALVGHGRGEGKDLGAPTANLHPLERAAVPPDGVYAGRVTVTEGTRFPAGISVGVPPTFPEAHDALEAHLIGFDGDLYGHRLTVEFFDRLRDQQVFSDTAALAAAIARDLEAVARLAEDRR